MESSEIKMLIKIKNNILIDRVPSNNIRALFDVISIYDWTEEGRIMWNAYIDCMQEGKMVKIFRDKSQKGRSNIRQLSEQNGGLYEKKKIFGFLFVWELESNPFVYHLKVDRCENKKQYCHVNEFHILWTIFSAGQVKTFKMCDSFGWDSAKSDKLHLYQILIF